MSLDTWLMIVTTFFSFAILVIAIYVIVRNCLLNRKYLQFYKLTWIDKKRGFPDNCKDTWGTFLYELYGGKLKSER